MSLSASRFLRSAVPAIARNAKNATLSRTISPSIQLFGAFSSSLRQFSSSASSSPQPVIDVAEVVHAAEEAGEDPSASLAKALTPSQIVIELDKHIVGQADAKRAVAIALRNRWRRHQLSKALQEEIVPSNILMLGPTGVGKTAIARRLAKLCQAPFVKVEATKYTETGYHGKDVDTIIRDLVENSIQVTRQKLRDRYKHQASKMVEDKIVSILAGEEATEVVKQRFRDMVHEGILDFKEIEIDVPSEQSRRPKNPLDGIIDLGSAGGMSGGSVRVGAIPLGGMFGIGGGKEEKATKKKKIPISQAREILLDAEADKMIDQDALYSEAVMSAEQDGIVFIDEIDKIVTSSNHRDGSDASAEGVQRDLLPLLEGTTINTKYGNVKTDHILFIASGAFHGSKPSDMLAELQGRLPIRVELKGLTRADFLRILTEPEFNILKQQIELLKTEGVTLEFSDAAIKAISETAYEANELLQNTGARRLRTVVEKLVGDISFRAPDLKGQTVVIEAPDVKNAVSELLKRSDLSRYIL